MTPPSAAPVWANDRLRLAVSAGCNISCTYCHNEGQPKTHRLLEDGLFRHLVEVLRSTAPKTITLTGGEALLHPRIADFAHGVKPYCNSITVVTNGILLTDGKLHTLIDAGVTKIRLGMDSMVAGRSRPSREPIPAFDVLQRIESILRSGVKLELNIVLTEFNLAEIPQLFRFCAEQQISAKVFEHVEVSHFGTDASPGEMDAKPVVGFDVFKSILDTAGVRFRVVEAPEYGEANYFLQADGFLWRYCCYLHPFGLCHLCGTRIEATGDTYVCMEKQTVETLSTADSVEVCIAKLRRINLRGCQGVTT